MRQFSSGADSITRSGSGLLSASGGPFTVACAFKPDDTLDGIGGGIFGSGSSSQYWQIYFTGSASVQFRASSGPSSTSLAFTTSTAYQFAVWRKAAAGSSAWDRRLYVNGALVASGGTTTSFTLPTQTGPVAIGREFASGITTYRGAVGECAAWNIALTDQQLLDWASGVMADQISKPNLIFYAPLRSGALSGEPDYSQAQPFAAASVLGVTNTSVVAHPDASGLAYPVPIALRQEPTWALDIDVPTSVVSYSTGSPVVTAGTSTRRAASVDLSEDAAVDTLGAAYPRAIANTEDISIAHELPDQALAVDIPSNAVVALANPSLIVPPAIEGLALWLDAATIPKRVDGDAIGDTGYEWRDLSRAGYRAVNTTAAQRPVLKTSIQNGLPVVRFDGSNDGLYIANFKLSASMTIFVAGAASAAPATMFVEHSSNANSNDGFYFYGTSGNSLQVRRGATNLIVSAAANWVGTSFGIMSGTSAASAKTATYLNGATAAQSASGAQTNSVVNDTLYIGFRGGGGLQSKCDIGSIVIYDRQLSDAERRQVEVYLAARWGVTLANGMPDVWSPSFNYQGCKARLRRYDRVSREVMTELQGVVIDATFPAGIAALEIGSHDGGLLSTRIPSQVVTVDDLPSATDLGAPFPVSFGTSYLAAPYVGKDEVSDPGGYDFAVCHTEDASGGTMQISIDGVYYDADGVPGLEQAVGWDAISGTATYVSPTSFSLTGDLRSRYAIGMLVRVVTGASSGSWAYSFITNVAYTSVTTITIDAAILDSGMNNVGNISKISPTPTAGGTGYVVGDVLTITTVGSNGKVRVMATTAGVVTALALTQPGQSYAAGTGKATSGGTGTGCTVTITETCRGQIASDFIAETSRVQISNENILSLRLFDLPGSDVIVKTTNASINEFSTAAAEVLANGAWGLGQSVNAASVAAATTALADANINDACNWTIGADKQQVNAADALNLLLMPRGGVLTKNYAGEWEIEYDTEPANPAITLGYGDGVYNNVATLGDLRRVPLDQSIRYLVLRYGPPIKSKTVDGSPAWMQLSGYIYGVKMLVNANGARDEIIALPHVTKYIHAARILYYLARRRRAEDSAAITLTAGYQARRLSRGDLATVSAPIVGVHGAMRVRKQVRRLTSFDMELVGYDASAYTYDGSQIASEGTASTATGNDAVDEEQSVQLALGDGANLVLNCDFTIALRKPTMAADMLPAWGVEGVASFTSLTATADYRAIGRSYLAAVVSGLTPVPSIYTTRALDQYTAQEVAYPIQARATYIGSIYADQPSGWKFLQTWFSATSTVSSITTPTVRCDPTDVNSLGWKRYYFACRAPEGAIGAALNIEFTATGTYQFDAVQFEEGTRTAGKPTKWKRHPTWGVDPALITPGALTVRPVGEASGGATIQTVSTSVTCSGGTTTATNIIPLGVTVLGVTVRVTTTITGATTFGVGDGTTATKWGTAIALASGTKTSSADFTALWSVPASRNVVLTANGSNFTGGVVKITVHYMSLAGLTA